MELKAEYQPSPFGPVPMDWSIATIKYFDPFITSGSRGWAPYYSAFGDAFIRITNMSRERVKLVLDDLQHVVLPRGVNEGKRTSLQVGDVLISITADIGIVCYVDETVPKPAFINQHIAIVRFRPETICPKFVAYFLAGEQSQRLFREGTDVGAKAGMSLGGVRAIRLAHPRINEQRAIAAALSDIDELLASLDALIAKKRNLKQATTQALLTGTRRLPSFSGNWRKRKLADICWMKSGKTITQAKIDTHSAYPCYGGNGLRGFTQTFTHEGCYALIGRQGALCGNVLNVSGKFFASEHAIVVTAFPEIAAQWLAFVLGEMRLNKHAESSAQPGLSVTKILELPVVVPPSKAEQMAIAITLSDMDSEIAALEARRDKTRALKQGMMQELLTGRIRLL